MTVKTDRPKLNWYKSAVLGSYKAGRNNKAIRIPKEFDLDHYIQSGSFAYLIGDPFQVELIFTANRGAHLKETPLSLDQVIEDLDDGRIRVKATVKNSNQLRWWLLGFGDEVVIISPSSLREEFTSLLERMLDHYKRG
jgi:predicted DNA-binding transcriptional regulator YafY